jgi:hypothetical protein
MDIGVEGKMQGTESINNFSPYLPNQKGTYLFIWQKTAAKEKPAVLNYPYMRP